MNRLDTGLIRSLDDIRFNRLVGMLTSPTKEILKLKYKAGLKNREIQEKLGISRPSFAQRLHRGERQIIEWIKES